ncbi:MAG: Nramp family divalent metal transporter [Bdellovibrionota bacterium]
MATKTLLHHIQKIGPGMAVAATGIGAADLIVSAVAGSKYGIAIVWTVVLGAWIKYVLNEGLGRWQMVTQTTVLEGWKAQFSPWVLHGFIIYLFFWGFIVAGALIVSCGMAAHSLIPEISYKKWSVVHSLAGLVLVLWGGYGIFETIMKWTIAGMFALTIVTGILVFYHSPDLSLVMNFIPPKGSLPFLMGLIGGVGGSVTLLNYSYWIREKGWQSVDKLPLIRWDLSLAYLLTGFFAVAMILISSQINTQEVSGYMMVENLGKAIGRYTGRLGQIFFQVGFWAAVFSSLLGVWQGVPYIFQDYCQMTRRNLSPQKSYRSFLVFLAIPTLSLLFFSKPVWVVIAYAITGSLFMPFLAITLWIMNNRSHMEGWRNSMKDQITYFIAVAGFLYLFSVELFKALF